MREQRNCFETHILKEESSSNINTISKSDLLFHELIILPTWDIFINPRNAQLLLSFFVITMDEEIRTMSIILMTNLFQRSDDNSLPIFEQSGFAPILLPHFPLYQIPSCFAVAAYRSYLIADYLLQNNFINILIPFLNPQNNNLGVFINCAEAISFSKYVEELSPLIPLFLEIILNSPLITLKISALNALSSYISLSQELCSHLVNSEIIENILSIIDMSQIEMIDSLIKLIGNCFIYCEIIPEPILHHFLDIISKGLDQKDDYLLEICLKALTNSDFSNFFDFLIQKEIPQRIFLLYQSENTWKMQSLLFESLCHFFQIAKDKEFFEQINFLNIFENDASSFMECISREIAECLKEIKLYGDDHQPYLDFLQNSEVVPELLEQLSASEDSEIQYILKYLNFDN